MSEEMRNYRVGNQHATTHGFSAENLCLTTEERPKYEALQTDFEKRFRPADPVEMEFVDEMVNARWRMKRIVTAETAAINNQIVINEKKIEKLPADEKKNLTDSLRTVLALDNLANERKTMPLLIRYQDCYRRAYSAAYKQLMQLQADRRKNPSPEPERPIESKKSMFFFENTAKIQNERLGLSDKFIGPLPRPESSISVHPCPSVAPNKTPIRHPSAANNDSA